MLAATYAKNYGPYEWKRQALQFDLMDLSKWLGRAADTKDDLDFYDLCVEYVASLNDAHDYFSIPSDFVARLNFTVDIYGGKPLVDSVDLSRLPAATFNIRVGDEVVSVDGVPAADLITSLMKYAVAGNDRSTRRAAAAYLSLRRQSRIPRAHEVPEESVVVLLSAEGESKTLKIPWIRSGSPLLEVGPLPNFTVATGRAANAHRSAEESDPLERLRNIRVDASQTVLNVGARVPYFTLPANFLVRQGRSGGDIFYSGSWEVDGQKLGYIRIADFSQSSGGFAVTSFATEIAWFQANTDGLIIDITRNPGGNACYVESLAAYLFPDEFRTVGFEVRATTSWILSFTSQLTLLKALGADAATIDIYAGIVDALKTANAASRGRTQPISLCGKTLQLPPAKDRSGNLVSYQKPLMLLTDEFSASGADAFAAIVQDNARGRIFGYRTMGAGGNVTTYPGVTPFTEGDTRVTESLMNRKHPVVVSDFPTSFYVENVGVRPDVQYDYMTRENLLNRGSAFVDAFTKAMVEYVNSLK